MGIKTRVKAALHRAGWAVARYPGPNDVYGQVMEAIRAYDVDVVLDVGANEGQFASALRELGYRGRIVSFEPAPDVFSRLRARAGDDRLWEVHNLGLADESGQLMLQVSEASDMSSLLPINRNYLDRLSRGRVVGEVKVDVATLDDLAVPGERLFVKTDTQGYDLRVLKGGQDTLMRARCLLMELAVIPNYDGVDNEWHTALDHVTQLGFESAGFFAIERDDQRRVTEMDGLFVRV